MVKQAHCLSVFDHFVILALKALAKVMNRLMGRIVELTENTSKK